MTTTKIRSIFIDGRAWYDRTYGNTYHSVRVWINGQVIGAQGMTYGYGEQYQETARRLIGRVVGLDYQSFHDLRNMGIDVYATCAEVKKRDLFADYDAESDWIAYVLGETDILV